MSEAKANVCQSAQASGTVEAATAYSVFIYVEGVARGNPGRGGWACVLSWQGNRKPISGGARKTTNNRMELRAVVEGLKATPHTGCDVTVISDSGYLVDAIRLGRLERWERNYFMKDDALRPNADLWFDLHQQLGRHTVRFRRRRRSENIESKNCHRMAVAARMERYLPADDGYEDWTTACAIRGIGEICPSGAPKLANASADESGVRSWTRPVKRISKEYRPRGIAAARYLRGRP